MKVFVDECVTSRLLPHLVGCDLTHISSTPWRGKQNGELLRLVERSYDVFLTTDRHLPEQQNLNRFHLAFVCLRGRSNKVEDLLPLVPDLRALADRAVSTGMAPPSDETFRGTLQGRTPEGDPATVIVTRRGIGQAGRVWVTFLGAIKTTQVLTDDQADQLAELIHTARRAPGLSG